MFRQVGEQAAGPTDTAFEKTEFQIRETLGDAAEQQAAREEMMALGEMAEMVGDEIGR